MKEQLKVHIVLKPELAKDLKSDDKEAAFKKAKNLSRRLHLKKPNLERVVRYGVLTGTVEPAAMEALRSRKEVQSFEVDSMKVAI